MPRKAIAPWHRLLFLKVPLWSVVPIPALEFEDGA